MLIENDFPLIGVSNHVQVMEYESGAGRDRPGFAHRQTGRRRRRLPDTIGNKITVNDQVLARFIDESVGMDAGTAPLWVVYGMSRHVGRQHFCGGNW